MLKTVSSIANAIGALNYKGTWDANANSPTLTSSIGTKGDYYVVGTAGTTSLNGISNWGIGDWAVFNGSVWQRVEGGADLNGVNLSVTGIATFGAGTVSAPAITTTGDTNTGIYFPAADSVAIADGGVQSFRTVSGNVVVGGAVSPNGKLTIEYSTTSSNGTYCENKADNVDVGGACFHGNLSSGTGTNNTTAVIFRGRSAGADRFYVFGNGNAVNTNGSYGVLSDVKWKENIVDATPKLDKLMQIRIVNYNLIGEEQKQLGVIAQEIEQVLPGLIQEHPDRDKDDNDLGTKSKSVKMSVFVPMLIKAMQEQQAMIKELQIEIAKMKG